MGNIYDRLLLEVRLILAVEKLLQKVKLELVRRQLYGQLIEGCIFLMKLRCNIVVVVATSLKKLPTETERARQGGEFVRTANKKKCL
jgi:hypothetical protein